MEERTVVTVFLTHRGDMLLLRRSEEVGSYSGAWGAVAGHVEDTPATAARQEIREETGLESDAVTQINRGEPFEVPDSDLDIRWTVNPFRFKTETRTITPNWETTETAWVSPPKIRERETVPELWTSWERVRPTLESVGADTKGGSATISRRALEVLRDEATLVAAENGGWEKLADLAADLRAAREAMAVVRVRIDRAMAAVSERKRPEALREVAHDGLKRAFHADRDTAERAAEAIEGRTVFTLSRSGTVERALELGLPESVNVALSRPGGEGKTLAKTLAERGQDVTLYEDTSIPRAVETADIVLVGADTIGATGAVVNKVGTRAAALAAERFTVPMTVAAATAKISSGPVETRIDPDSEVADATASPLRTVHPHFERIESELIDRVLTEKGALDGTEIGAVADRHADLGTWMANR
ncbi:NUDIX domain-containing protein [Halodesulfurarchaeum sp.]|uniref:NUDIX domain-containing protein n=1 Tax=Halodesulfurarchaeum sp. TaxID=1980530 RepID=UPI002FC3A629